MLATDATHEDESLTWSQTGIEQLTWASNALLPIGWVDSLLSRFGIKDMFASYFEVDIQRHVVKLLNHIHHDFVCNPASDGLGQLILNSLSQITVPDGGSDDVGAAGER